MVDYQWNTHARTHTHTHTHTQGLYKKAEALYSMGDFEYALVFYHRGHKIRPELHEFTLGIQKAQEAINNSIGSAFVHLLLLHVAIV